jgi:glycosyltransferase involved in cell wall biosynthesis
MKIISIVPGFGGTFYCGNCLRDSAFVTSLRNAGHDASILPMYLPLSINGSTSPNDIPVFYGAVNIYLKQQFPIMRKMPDWMERLFNSPFLLRFAAKKSGSTRATGLEEMTESMLLGKEGFQSHELQQLVDFLKHHEKPDIVHFSNALLLGMAKQIREELQVPVVCSLQDEDIWVDAMSETYRKRIWDLMAEKGEDVDAFIAVSDYFSGLMQQKMAIPADKIHVLHIGIDPSRYEYNPPATVEPAIGYLSRIYEENGFGLLVDAFIKLKSEHRFRELKLKVTGGMTGDDRKFIETQIEKLKRKGMMEDLDIIDDFSQSSLFKFFRSISVLSVPVLKGEAFGLYQLEALASGIPLVQPDLGAFPEIIRKTGGGTIYTPNTSSALAKALGESLSDRNKLLKMSQDGRKGVIDSFDCRVLTHQMIEIYEDLVNKRKS